MIKVYLEQNITYIDCIVAGGYPKDPGINPTWEEGISIFPTFVGLSLSAKIN